MSGPGGLPGPGGEVMPVKVIRSARRSFALELRGEGLLVRAPHWATDGQIRDCIARHRAWIDKAAARRERQRREIGDAPPLTAQELRALAEQALAYIPERVRTYAPQVGVTYGRVTIRSQRTRWGSCSAKGNLNFNCLLMLTPPEVIDSVVVHELCHRKQMDHSPRFYAEVLRVFPEYHKWNGWLKEHGEAIMRRMTG